MDIKEFFEIARQICRPDNCDHCPINYFCEISAGEITDLDIELALSAVEHFKKCPKAMTYKDIFFKMFPNGTKTEDGYPDLCRGFLNGKKREQVGYCDGNKDCEDCWNEEYKEG